MSGDPNMPGGPGDYNARFARMNINAQPFVPNVQAPQFVPMGYPSYAGAYPVHGAHQMPPGGPVYAHPPPPGMGMGSGMHRNVSPHGGHYMMPPHPHHGQGGVHGMGTVAQQQQQQQQPIPVSALEAEHQSSPAYHQQQHQQQQPHPSSSSSSSPSQGYRGPQQHGTDIWGATATGGGNGGGGKTSKDQAAVGTFSIALRQQPYQDSAFGSSGPTLRSEQPALASDRPFEKGVVEISQENPVDSWEDIGEDVVDAKTGEGRGEEAMKTDKIGTSSDSSSSTSSSSSLSSQPQGDVQRKSPDFSTGSSEQQQPNHVQKGKYAAVSKEVGAASLSRKQPLSSSGSARARVAGEGGEPGKTLSKAAPKKEEDEKENVNIIFIGHVDAGKSTIGGHVMYLTGQVDKRTLEKYEREAKEKNRETWYLSWALDTNQEERDKGKTVEVGRASFETLKKRFTILDAPGHAGFVPNMISGAAQADIGVLVISARKGEFETGFERKGQTREHAMLAKTAGVKHLVVLINKMDDHTVGWSEDRYEECKTKLTPFLKKVGFNPKTDIFFIPVSGLAGFNLKERAGTEVCPWYSGPAFIPYLDDLPPLSREDSGPFRMPIADKYKDMGTIVMGKVESGGVTKGASLLLMPNRVTVEVLGIMRVEEEVPAAFSGDNIKLKLRGVEEEDILPGFVLCEPSLPCHVGSKFEAQIVILEHKSIICAGYGAVLHIHNVVEEVQITQLKALVDRKTGKRVAQRPRFVKQDQIVIACLQTSGVICLETFKEFPQMARFTLRDEGKTIAIGKVLKLAE